MIEVSVLKTYCQALLMRSADPTQLAAHAGNVAFEAC